MANSSPFRDNNTGSTIDKASLLEHFTGPNAFNTNRPVSGKETWSVAWSQDKQYLAWSCGGGEIRVLSWLKHKRTLKTLLSGLEDTREWQPCNCDPFTFNAHDLVWSMAFCTYPSLQRRPGEGAGDGKKHFRYKTSFEVLLAAGLNSGRIRVWDMASRTVFYELLDHRDVVRDLRVSMDSRCLLASAGRDGSIKIWELLDDGNLRHSLVPKNSNRWVHCCAWSPDGSLLCAGGEGRMLTLWSAETFRELRTLSGHSHTIAACDFSPDGTLLATASYDTWVIIWNPHTGDQLLKLQHMFPAPLPIFAGGANSSYVRSVSFSPDGSHVATVCDDTYVRFWDLTDPCDPQQIATIPNALTCSYCVDGSTLAVGTRNGSLTLWAAPMAVQTLQQNCRTVVRRTFTKQNLQKLGLPKKFITYLSSPELPVTLSEE